MIWLTVQRCRSGQPSAGAVQCLGVARQLGGRLTLVGWLTLTFEHPAASWKVQQEGKTGQQPGLL